MAEQVRVCILGGSGFLGLNLILGLSGLGMSVLTTVRSERAKQRIEQALPAQSKADVTIIIADLLSDLTNIKALDEGESFDLVVNATGYSVQRDQTDPLVAEQVNSILPGKLLAHFDRANVKKFIQLGTAYEFGPLNGSISEVAEPVPNNLYGKTKLDGMRRLFQTDLEYTKLIYFRLFGIFGPFETETKLFPQLFKAVCCNEDVKFSDGLQKLDYLHVDNIVELINCCLHYVPTQTHSLFVIGSGRAKSIREIANIFIEQYPNGQKPKWGETQYRNNGSSVQFADSRLAKSELAWDVIIDLNNGIEKYCAAMKSQNTQNNL